MPCSMVAANGDRLWCLGDVVHASKTDNMQCSNCWAGRALDWEITTLSCQHAQYTSNSIQYSSTINII
jgi:hypothetical protein